MKYMICCLLSIFIIGCGVEEEAPFIHILLQAVTANNGEFALETANPEVFENEYFRDLLEESHASFQRVFPEYYAPSPFKWISYVPEADWESFINATYGKESHLVATNGFHVFQSGFTVVKLIDYRGLDQSALNHELVHSFLNAHNEIVPILIAHILTYDYVISSGEKVWEEAFNSSNVFQLGEVGSTVFISGGKHYYASRFIGQLLHDVYLTKGDFSSFIDEFSQLIATLLEMEDLSEDNTEFDYQSAATSSVIFIEEFFARLSDHYNCGTDCLYLPENTDADGDKQTESDGDPDDFDPDLFHSITANLFIAEFPSDTYEAFCYVLTGYFLGFPNVQYQTTFSLNGVPGGYFGGGTFKTKEKYYCSIRNQSWYIVDTGTVVVSPEGMGEMPTEREPCAHYLGSDPPDCFTFYVE